MFDGSVAGSVAETVILDDIAAEGLVFESSVADGIEFDVSFAYNENLTVVLQMVVQLKKPS